MPGGTRQILPYFRLLLVNLWTVIGLSFVCPQMNEYLKIGGLLLFLVAWLASLITGENAVFRTSANLTQIL